MTDGTEELRRPLQAAAGCGVTRASELSARQRDLADFDDIARLELEPLGATSLDRSCAVHLLETGAGLQALASVEAA